ncbi:MAG: hypothetical protein JNJ57_00300 [Saprospiraceae bacterium]|nr:hypothetical protein [Saprospiraceae bacterium]
MDPQEINIHTSSEQRNFGLTPEAFEHLAQQLRNGNELLFEKLFLSKFKSCMGILIKKYRASHEDAYDSMMWAMLQMRRLLIENKVVYGNLEAYLVRIAVNEYLKKLERSREVSTEHFPEGNWEPDFLSEPETLGILDKAWEKLGAMCQTLLKGFYYDKIELKKLTQILEDSSEANTRKKKERCLIELRKQFFRYYE